MRRGPADVEAGPDVLTASPTGRSDRRIVIVAHQPRHHAACPHGGAGGATCLGGAFVLQPRPSEVRMSHAISDLRRPKGHEESSLLRAAHRPPPYRRALSSIRTRGGCDARVWWPAACAALWTFAMNAGSVRLRASSRSSTSGLSFSEPGLRGRSPDRSRAVESLARLDGDPRVAHRTIVRRARSEPSLSDGTRGGSGSRFDQQRGEVRIEHLESRRDAGMAETDAEVVDRKRPEGRPPQGRG